MQLFNLFFIVFASLLALLNAQEELNKLAVQPHLNDTIISCGAYQNDACNCVYYARDRQPALPGGLTTCSDKKSKANSPSPAAGCVLFRTGDPTYCHAAYITKVSSGTIYYDQVNLPITAATKK